MMLARNIWLVRAGEIAGYLHAQVDTRLAHPGCGVGLERSLVTPVFPASFRLNWEGWDTFVSCNHLHSSE